MSSNDFSSSDSARSAVPLKHVQTLKLGAPLKLELGGELSGVSVAFETYGQLSTRRDNAVLLCHALSGDSHVAAHDAGDDPGWWDIAVGPGKAIDTDRYFVICPNVLGGCRGTTGPASVNPATGKPYGRDFPVVTVGDMVEVEWQVVRSLGVEQLLAVIGGSMGGHRVLHWATKRPGQVRGAIPIATSPRLTSQALAFDVVARNAILRDPCFHGGQYYGAGTGPEIGLAIARMLGHITYLSREAMRDKFERDRHQPRDIATDFEKRFSVGSYLAYQGERFVERFDANSYLALSMAMDLFDLGGGAEGLRSAMAGSLCRWLVISFSSDWLFPPDQSQEVVDALLAGGRSVSFCNVTSKCGHDAFLLENDLAEYGQLVRAFLGNLSGQSGAAWSEACESTSRLDYELIVELSKPGHSVLDLGCGQGELLELLHRRGHEHLMGVEIDEQEIIACVQRGLDVVHADLNQGLRSFGDGQFDFVVLSQTLQAVRDVETVLDEVLRVGRRGIVTFPNFAYYKLRKMLWEQGRAPEASGVLKYKWYNSPNIRFLTIADFESYCADRGITVHRRLTIDSEAGVELNDDPNLNADLAIFVISR